MVTKTAPKTKAAKTVEPVAAEQPQISISRIALREATIPLIGTSPLIVHNFSEKSKRQMLDAMQGKRTPKTAKNPEEEYQAAFYRMADGGYCLPAAAFLQATISAARFYGKEVSMTALRQFLFVQGEMGTDGQLMVRITGDDPEMREDVVRVGMKGTDLRYRPIFHHWKAELRLVFVISALTNDSVLSLVDAGGLGVGVGEWRPEHNGNFGRYQIDPDRAVTFREVQ